MAGEDIIMATQEELKRLHVVQKILEGGLKQVEAAEILSLSDRQVRRVVKRVKAEGGRGIVHKSRGKPSNRKLPDETKGKALVLYRQRYNGFGATLAAEKIKEVEGIQISDETLRTWLIEVGEWKKVRKKRVHRQWRERKHCFGEMIQIDGSHHDWFEGRGDKCVLMGYIDDAANRTYCRFYEYEGTVPAMDSFKRYILRHGIPMSVYLDKHTTYKSPRQLTPEEEIMGITEPLSEFERALKELGVKVIHANSPQALEPVDKLF